MAQTLFSNPEYRRLGTLQEIANQRDNERMARMYGPPPEKITGGLLEALEAGKDALRFRRAVDIEKPLNKVLLLCS